MIHLPKALTGLSLTIALVVITHSASCQTDSRSEFDLYPNGLIYADSSIVKLRHMVDSLNLKYKSCDLSRTYYSYPQGRLWHVQFSSPTDNLKALRKDLDEGRPLVYLLDKYKELVVKMDTLLLAVELGKRSKGKGWEFLVGNPDEGYELREAIKYHLYPGQWQYE